MTTVMKNALSADIDDWLRVFHQQLFMSSHMMPITPNTEFLLHIFVSDERQFVHDPR